MKLMFNFIEENRHSYNAMHHSRYTTSLRNITYDYIKDNNKGDYEGYKKPIPTMEECRNILFDFEYPILNETLSSEYMGTINIKDMFENSFVSKYFVDEIAFESFAEFKMRLRGKLFEVIPMFNLKMKVLLSLTANDFKGGYHLEEQTNNTHSDTDDRESSNKTKGISNDFPVNIIDLPDDLKDVDYATNGSITDRTGNDTLVNNGEYETIHIADKTDRKQILYLMEMMNKIDDLISSTLKQFGYLFIGIY